MKIYMVTSGSYSDYSVDAIFSTRELAQSYINSFAKSEWNVFNEIEEWELNPCEIEIKANRKPFEVIMTKDGVVTNVTHSYSANSHITPISIFTSPTHNNMIVNCFADDEKHAIEIANEKRIEILALNMWGKV